LPEEQAYPSGIWNLPPGLVQILEGPPLFFKNLEVISKDRTTFSAKFQNFGEVVVARGNKGNSPRIWRRLQKTRELLGK
jgi:hypothetical protein